MNTFIRLCCLSFILFPTCSYAQAIKLTLINSRPYFEDIHVSEINSITGETFRSSFSGHVKFTLHNFEGKHVRSLGGRNLMGTKHFNIDTVSTTGNLPSGIYYIKAVFDDFSTLNLTDFSNETYTEMFFIAITDKYYDFVPDIIGTNDVQTVKVSFLFAEEDIGHQGNIYLAILYNDNYYYHNGEEYMLWQVGTPIPYWNRQTLSNFRLTCFMDYDFTKLPGIEFYVGYGKSEADLLSGKYAKIY